MNKYLQIGIVSAIVVVLGMGVWRGIWEKDLLTSVANSASYSGLVGVADIGISFEYPEGWYIDVSKEDRSFIKILSPDQLGFKGENYEDLTGYRKTERKIIESPIYLRVVATGEIPFFAQLIHLSGMGLEYPDKREKVDGFLPDSETLEVKGRVAPGTFFITRYGQTIFEFYRPSTAQHVEVFHDLIKSFKIHDQQTTTLTQNQRDQYDLAFTDANYNIWLMNSDSSETVKIWSKNSAHKIYSWQPKIGRVIYSPITRASEVELEYIDSPTETQKVSDVVGVRGIVDLVVTKQGRFLYSTPVEGMFSEPDDYVSGPSAYLSTDNWLNIEKISGISSGLISVSPDGQTILEHAGVYYGSNDYSILKVGSKKKFGSLLVHGSSAKWLSSDEFLYLRTKPNHIDGRNFLAKYNLQTRVSTDLGPRDISSYDLSTDGRVVTYVVFDDDTKANRAFQYEIENSETSVIETKCAQQIFSLTSGDSNTFAFYCHDIRNNNFGFYLWTKQKIVKIPYNPISVAFSE